MRRQRVSRAPHTVAVLLACFLLAACAPGAKDGADEEGAPSPRAMPAHLCDSRMPTGGLRRIYPKGAAGGVRMTRESRSTGDIEHFMEKQAETGDSQWICSIQFTGSNAEASLAKARIVSIAPGNSTSLDDITRLAGDHPRSMSLGAVRGVNGPRRTAVTFPCVTGSHEKRTLLVGLFHPVGPYGSDTRGEKVRRSSADYVLGVARDFVETQHPCTNMTRFPSGDPKSSPIPE